MSRSVHDLPFEGELETLALFVDVVKGASFTTAAERWGLSKSAVSRRVGQLEERLGLRLLQRSTRKLSLTEAGELLYRRCVEALGLLEQVRAELSEMAEEPSGNIRFNAPSVFGARALPAIVAAFQQRFPRVGIALSLSDKLVDLVEEGIDLSLRVGPVEEGSLIARRISSTPWITCASPSYFDQHGQPDHPRALTGHNCLHYANVPMEREWRYQEMGAEFSPPVSGRLSADSGETVRQFALSGTGIAHLPEFYVEEDLKLGVLVQVLADFEPQPLPISLLYPSRRHQPPAVRALIGFLQEHFPRCRGMASDGHLTKG